MEYLKDRYYKKNLMFYLPIHLAKMLAETQDDSVLEELLPSLIPYIEQMKVVQDNISQAHEDIPESMYGSKKIMLYIPISINGKYFEAFIDSGAGMSIMNKQVAIEAGVFHLCDPTIKFKAIGVGSQTTSGKIHKIDFIANGNSISWGFDVMEGDGISLILGLDFLKSYRANIDMKKDCLIINDIKIPFLKEIHMHDSNKNKKEVKVEDIYGKELIQIVDKAKDIEELKEAIEMSLKDDSKTESTEEIDSELEQAIKMSLQE